MVTRDVLKERWDAALLEAYRDEDGSLGVEPNERFARVNEALDELAVLLVRDVAPGDVDEVVQGIWDDIERRLFDWAESYTHVREVAA